MLLLYTRRAIYARIFPSLAIATKLSPQNCYNGSKKHYGYERWVRSMIFLESYIRQGRSALRRLALDPRVHIGLRCLGYWGCGFALSAGSLAGGILPLAAALVCACTGWAAVLVGFGGVAGYWVFWQEAGYQAMVWTCLALAVSLLLRDRKLLRSAPLLLPAATALIVATTGVLFQRVAADGTAVLLYLLRVLVAFGATWLFCLSLQGRNPLLDWLVCGVGVLALAQIMPIPYLGLGYVAAGIAMTAGSFPAAALAGLSLDLAQITPVPMAAALSLGYWTRFLPRSPRWLTRFSPGAAYCLVMSLCGRFDLYPLPGLVLGGIIGSFLPGPAKANHRRGETGAAQVRLELAAGVLAQTEQILLEAKPAPVDEQALIQRAAETACGSCPYRKSCKDAKRIGQNPGLVLSKPLLSAEELPIICRKSGRFLAELHRAQEQLRSIQADRERQREYRAAVVQQYRFMAEFLQELSDQLSRRAHQPQLHFTPQAQVFGNRPESENGDRCLRFAGAGGCYYVLLCDGMGTGLGAVQEGKKASELLKKLLCAGFPPEHALRSLNSLCALRERAGAVTIDLARIRLDSGKVSLYKWGAAPSIVMSAIGAEQLGMASPPPGLSVTDCRELRENFSLRRGQTLLLLSDGIAQQEALAICREFGSESWEQLGRRILSCCDPDTADDATLVMIRLSSEI